MIFILMVVLVFPVVWLAFQGLQPPYQRLLSSNAELVYTLQSKRIQFSTASGRIVFKTFVRPGFEADVGSEGLGANWVFLVSLLLVTPGLVLLNRLIRLAAGLLLLFLTHVFFIVDKVEITLLQAAHPLAGASWFWNTVDNFLEVVGKSFFPVAIWLLLALPYLLGKIDQRSPVAVPKEVARNAPCPCGSGKKYKHCCGK